MTTTTTATDIATTTPARKRGKGIVRPDTLTFTTDAGGWLAAFVNADGVNARVRLVKELPDFPSGGWRAVLKEAHTRATTDGQGAIARRLASRSRCVDAPNRADDGGTAVCPNPTCAHNGDPQPMGDFGVRFMPRQCPVDALGVPQFPAGHVVKPDSVYPLKAGWVAYRIVVRQAQCKDCR
jgi:hypothetical protein